MIAADRNGIAYCRSNIERPLSFEQRDGRIIRHAGAGMKPQRGMVVFIFWLRPGNQLSPSEVWAQKVWLSNGCGESGMSGVASAITGPRSAAVDFPEVMSAKVAKDRLQYRWN